MSKILEFAEADKTFKESMAKLNFIKNTIDIADKELTLLDSIEIKLYENIITLKQNGVITSIQEYSKIKQEHSDIVSKIITLRNAMETQKKNYAETEKIMVKAKEVLGLIQTSMHNNVVEFREKHGKE